jgi:signal transduction histidine kinase
LKREAVEPYVGLRADRTPFPPSLPPEAVDTPNFEPSEWALRPVAPAIALAVADRALCDSLSGLLRRAGRVAGGNHLVPVAAVVITDAEGGATPAVASLRARTRSDAAIIVILTDSARASEVNAAYEAGAILCLKTPLDEHQLLAVIGSVLELHTVKVHADGLTRQLDVQSHLASLGRVTAGFTHEVSTPLAVLLMTYETIRTEVNRLLRERDETALIVEVGAPSPTERLSGQNLSPIVSADEVRATLDDMGAALERMRGVLGTARVLAQESLTAAIEDTDVASAVRDVRRWAATELEGIEFQELIEGPPIVACADPRLLGQIVLNLVANAANAARQLPSPRVRLHVYGSSDTVIVSVRDNGPGVPPEIRDRIFEPFFTTRRGQGGTGLGLALCREYAARMQAHLTLWTAPGRGACFRIHLRRAKQ